MFATYSDWDHDKQIPCFLPNLLGLYFVILKLYKCKHTYTYIKTLIPQECVYCVNNRVMLGIIFVSSKVNVGFKITINFGMYYYWILI